MADNVYRIELYIHNSKYFKRFQTIEDIIKPETIKILYSQYFAIYNKIVKVTPIDYSKLSAKDIIKIQAFRDNMTTQILKRYYPQSNKKYKSECVRLLKKVSNTDFDEKIKNELANKLDYLLSH
ncbi:MAG: hypothetical protein IT237_00120 [Bacteroidia bacterium]|nr:hypothetical protein [Bacteroidia bacterium]